MHSEMNAEGTIGGRGMGGEVQLLPLVLKPILLVGTSSAPEYMNKT